MRGAPELPTGRVELTTEVGLPAALLLAWGTLALINATFIAALDRADPRHANWLWHHAYDAGHMLALGVFSFALAWVWARYKPARRLWAFVALFCFASALAWFATKNDIAGFVERRQAAGSRLPWRALLSLGVAALVLFAMAIGSALDRPRWRWLGLAAGASLGVLNNSMLAYDYFGVHLFVALCAAVLTGCALATTRKPRLDTRKTKGIVVAGGALLAGAAAWAVFVAPSRAVWRELYRVPGSVLAPYLAGLLPESRQRAEVPLPIEASSWFQRRNELAPIASRNSSLAPDRAIVIVITVDALRADLVNDVKHAETLPALHALRNESVYFSSARTPSPSTLTTLFAIATGKYYSATYWSSFPNREGHYPHRDESPRLQQLLSSAGIRTVQPIAVHGLASGDGFGLGFDEEVKTRADYGSARELMDIAISRLQRGFDGRAFMLMHIIDAHAPYDLAGTHGSPYDAFLRELKLVDDQLGRLTRFLCESGLEKRTILVVSADHGEAFGEHGAMHHAVTVHDEVIRVPLMIRVPGVDATTVDTPVTLMDLGPTVLDLMGLPTPGRWMGQSLAPFLAGKSARLDRPIAVDGGRRIRAMVFPDGIKVIEDIRKRTVEVYDLNRDPGERRNIVDEMGMRGDQYLLAMRRFFAVHALDRPGYEPPMRRF